MIFLINRAWLKIKLRQIANKQKHRLCLAITDCEFDEIFDLICRVKEELVEEGFKIEPWQTLIVTQEKYRNSYDGYPEILLNYYDDFLFSHEVDDVFFRDAIHKHCMNSEEYTFFETKLTTLSELKSFVDERFDDKAQEINYNQLIDSLITTCIYTENKPEPLDNGMSLVRHSAIGRIYGTKIIDGDIILNGLMIKKQGVDLNNYDISFSLQGESIWVPGTTPKSDHDKYEIEFNLLVLVEKER